MLVCQANQNVGFMKQRPFNLNIVQWQTNSESCTSYNALDMFMG